MEYIEDSLMEASKKIITEEMRHTECRMDDITFQIDFQNSNLFSTTTGISTAGASIWRHDQRHCFLPDESRKNALGIGESNDGWDIISCIKIHDYTFSPIIRWPVQPEHRDQQIQVMVRMIRIFSELTHQMLTGYFHFEHHDLNIESASYESELLNHAVTLSRCINCAACIDGDGFILGMSNPSEESEDISLRLSQYNAVIINELKALKSTVVSSVTFSGNSRSALFGGIDGTPFILAVSSNGGDRSSTLSYLAYRCIKDGMTNRIKETGGLWGSLITQVVSPGFYRDSWLTRPKLIVKGKYVSKSGSDIFHIPSCRLLVSTNARRLMWFETRKSVIQSKLHPCRICNP